MILYIFIALTILLTLIYLSLVFSFYLGWKNIPLFKVRNLTFKTKVSIIVAARNEEDNIKNTIQDILQQDYPTTLFELIVVDDHSTDKTAEIVKSFATKGVKLISLKENAINSYKKKAIETAIAAANGDLIVTTDADCSMGKFWLSTIVAYYEQHQFKMISSPVMYFKEKSFFEYLQSLEFSYLIGMGASTIGHGKPSTCNGANLAYEKSAFYAVNGFSGIDNLASGDDELLLHKIVEKFENSVGFLKNKEAIVYTEAKPDMSSFIAQRKRWASKTVHNKSNWTIFTNISIWSFNLSLLLTFLLGLFFYSQLLSYLACYIILKIFIEFLFLFPVLNFFKRKSLLWYLPILNLIHVFYFVYIGFVGNTRDYQWKGRTVK